jgi:hypothetical protein
MKNVKIVIFSSPSRKKMLRRLTNELNGLDVSIIDSNETFGKMNFWKRWELARKICLNSKHNNFLVLPDDVHELNLQIIQELFDQFKNRAFVCSVIFDGRTENWKSIETPINNFAIRDYKFKDLGFFDCGGLSNRATFNQFAVHKVSRLWFRNPNASSGVGMQLTFTLRNLNVPMFMPMRSLCTHGNHTSVMNPEIRKTQPLISIK